MGMSRQYNAVTDMVDGNVKRGYGEKTAFIDPERSLTYGQLQSESMRMASLLDGLEIDQESRVAMLLLDTVDYPIAFWGAIRAGVIPVCLNTLLTTAQYEYILADSRVQALFVSAPLLKAVEPLFDQLKFLRHIIVVGGEDTGYPDFQKLLNNSSTEYNTADTCGDEAAFWLYSSGSTGDPKGVRHVHTSPIYVAENYGKGIIGIQHDEFAVVHMKERRIGSDDPVCRVFFRQGLNAPQFLGLNLCHCRTKDRDKE